MTFRPRSMLEPRERADGLLVGAESIFFVHRALVSELAARYRLPAMYPYSIQLLTPVA